MSIVLFILVAVVIMTVVSGGYVFLLACVRRKEYPWLDEDAMKKVEHGKYFKYILASHDWLNHHDKQNVYIRSFDGLKLHGYWVPAKNPRGTVLLAHGYRSTVLLDLGFAFEFYHSRGFNLLIPQQRSHGESQGKFITFGVKESQDILSWIHFHNKTFGDYPIVLNGISMGASSVLYLADRKLPTNVKGIIADCGFTSPKDIIAEVYERIIRLPVIPTLWAVEFFARVFAGFSLEEMDTRKSLSKSRLPVLLIHGTKDGFVPCRMSVEAYNVCAGDKELLLVEGADHGLSFLVGTTKYVCTVDKFIHKVLEA